MPGWHAQMITVAYERARGLRTKNQTSTGRFEVAVERRRAQWRGALARRQAYLAG